MKIKLPNTEKNVIVNREKGVVVTILTTTENNKTFKFIGKAVCSPDDEFNEEIGKVISYKRARKKLLIEVRNNIRANIKYIQQGINYYKDMECDITNKINELKAEINNAVE